MTIPDIWLPADTVRLGNGLNGPGRVKGTLALVVDDELLAAFATTSPEPAPATVLGEVVGTADTQHGSSTPAPTPAGRVSSWPRPADGSPTA